MLTARSYRPAVSVLSILLLAMAANVCLPHRAFAATKAITDADKGGVVHLKLGDTLEVSLKSNPTTGFMWYVEKESTPLLKLHHQSQTDVTEPGEGRPVFQVFQFEPKRSGDGVLRLHYVRSWEKPTPDDEQFDIRVVIE
ncbi:MAG: protease inhibitor I42 family protein [Terracidiphilus sp.]|jgi:predicted secreted protein